MSISTFNRYEKKFIVSKEQMQCILAELSDYLRYDNYSKDGKPYRIYNIYFDTFDDNVIRHSLSKPFYKEKVRLRYYDNDNNVNKEFFLEIKRKVGSTVTKRRAMLTYEDAFQFIRNHKLPNISTYIDKQVLRELNYIFMSNEIYGKVFLSYERIALFAKDNPQIRITFDNHILTRRENVGFDDLSGDELLPPNTYIMEIKFLDVIPPWITKVLSKLQIYSRSFSKYGNEYQKEIMKHA